MKHPLTEPRRIAFAGCWHGDPRWACLASATAALADADVIVHTGDFGYMFQPKYLGDLGEVLEDADVPLLFVDGNHENHRWLARQPIDPDTGLRRITRSIWHMPRGFRWQWGTVRFLALGGAHSVDGIWRRQTGALWQPEERITDAQATAAAEGGRVDVLVSHDCPDGVDIPGLDPDAFPQIEILRAEEHRRILRSVVDVVQPRVIVHGHYHVRYQANPNLGWGPVQVNGLHSNAGGFDGNIQLVYLDDLARRVKEGL